jgi:hypothetical protein
MIVLRGLLSFVVCLCLCVCVCGCVCVWGGGGGDRRLPSARTPAPPYRTTAAS